MNRKIVKYEKKRKKEKEREKKKKKGELRVIWCLTINLHFVYGSFDRLLSCFEYYDSVRFGRIAEVASC